MKLTGSFESGKHFVFCARVLKPTLSGEEPLRYILTCPETVKDRAPTKAPRAQAVVDCAREIRREVLARRACRFIERKIRGT
jgi:hypothetical protein